MAYLSRQLGLSFHIEIRENRSFQILKTVIFENPQISDFENRSFQKTTVFGFWKPQNLVFKKLWILNIKKPWFLPKIVVLLENHIFALKTAVFTENHGFHLKTAVSILVAWGLGLPSNKVFQTKDQ